MNTGIQDSFNLAWKLALVVKGLSAPSLLDSYSEERIPVITEMISQTTKLLKKALGKDESTLQLNGNLFQLGVNYRWSSIVVDERKAIEAGREAEEDAYMEDFQFDDDEDDEEKLDSYGVDHDGRLRAGDRAPDSSGLKVRSPVRLAKQVCQLFQIFASSHHTILIFSDLADFRDVLRVCSLYPKDAIRTVVITRAKKHVPLDTTSADFILDDRDGHAHASYCPRGICGIVVVRPDGVVGAIAQGRTGMNRYFRGIFTAKTT
jgi:hypothetical protein